MPERCSEAMINFFQKKPGYLQKKSPKALILLSFDRHLFQ
jgi:hypothetical protein